MKIEKECQCCGMICSIRFEQIASDLDPDLDEDQTNTDEDTELYPEFCPFCGTHESAEESLEDYE